MYGRPYDSSLLIPAIEAHEEQLGSVPHPVPADAAFYSSSNEKAAHEKGVKRVCVPNRNTKSAERKQEEKKRWFREGQRWWKGSEERIGIVKRRHVLNRCRHKGERGVQRWVVFGVIADNLIDIGRVLTDCQSQSNYGFN